MSMGVLTFSRLNLPRVNGKLKRKKRGSTKWKTLLQSCQINLLPNINCGFLSYLQNTKTEDT